MPGRRGREGREAAADRGSAILFAMAGDGVMRVVAAAVVDRRQRLLVVSKKVAPEVFFLPGGKPESGESPEETLVRELEEELGVSTLDMNLIGRIEGAAALEPMSMHMTLFAAKIAGRPAPCSELAALGWTDGRDAYLPRLAPTIRDQVLPLLLRSGALDPP